MAIGVKGWRGLWDSGNVEEMDAEEGDDETHKEGNGVGAVGCVEALEEDEGGDYCSGGKADVIHRVDHIGGECIQGFVEVVHLNEDTEGDDDTEDVGTWVCELVVATDSEFDCDAEAFDGHDGDGTDD